MIETIIKNNYSQELSGSNVSHNKLRKESLEALAIFSLEDRSIFGFEFRDDGFFTQSQLAEFNLSEKIRSLKLVNQIHQNHVFLSLKFEDLIQDLNSSSGLNSQIRNQILKYGLKPSETYLQINSFSLDENFHSFVTAVDFLKELGFKIIMKGFGKESVNLELLGALKPDIIKIDLSEILDEESTDTKTVLAYLKDFSLSNGSSLFFSGIHSESSLSLAIDFGSLYLQGSLFGGQISIQSQSFLDIFTFGEKIDSYHKEKRKKISKEISFESELLKKLEDFIFVTKDLGDRIILDAQSIFKISNVIHRIYITDWIGTQVSAYYERVGDFGFKEDKSSLGKNWAYLPFFYKHVKKSFREPEKWQISDPYFDQNLKQYIVVFSKIIEKEYSIFLDLAFDLEK